MKRETEISLHVSWKSFSPSGINDVQEHQSSPFSQGKYLLMKDLLLQKIAYVDHLHSTCRFYKSDMDSCSQLFSQAFQ